MIGLTSPGRSIFKWDLTTADALKPRVKPASVPSWAQALVKEQKAPQTFINTAHEAVGRAFSPKSIDVTDEWK